MIYGFMDPYLETFTKLHCYIPIGLTARPECKWQITAASSKLPSFSLIPIYTPKQSGNLKPVLSFLACVHLDLRSHISTTAPKIFLRQPGMKQHFTFRMLLASKIMVRRLPQVMTMILEP